jgi:hypothetical protein
MTTPTNSLSKQLPWIFTFLSLILAVIGWQQFFSAKKKIKYYSQKAQNAELKYNEAQENAKDKDIELKNILAIPNPTPSPKSSKVENETCLNNPIVKRKILEKAKSLASVLSTTKVEDYKDEEKEKRSKKVHKFFDSVEKVFVSAINSYAEKNELEEQDSIKLHGIIENGFDKQRKIFDRLQTGEITRKESKTLGASSREEDKVALIALLGVDETKSFMEVFRDEAQKAREAQKEEPQE